MKNIIAAVSAFCVGTATRARERGPVLAASFASFARDFAVTTVSTPREMWRWWKAGHTVTPYLQSGTVESDRDYALWRKLGVASDAVLLVLVLTIALLIVLAVF